MKLLSVIIRFTLLAMVVITPWMFGGVWARTQWALMLFASVLLAGDLVSRFGKYDQTSWMPTSWLPLLFGIAIGIAQLIPISPGLAETLAPENLAIRKQFDTPANNEANETKDPTVLLEASRAPARKITRSVYPAATREYLSLLVLATACFILASTHAIDRKSIKSFFVGVTVCGALMSFFGIIQRLSWNGKFYWFVDTTSGSFASFGPFVNRNNAGGFLNMCLALGIGLLLSMKTEELPSLGDEGRRRSSKLPKKKERKKSRSRRSTASAPTEQKTKGVANPKTPDESNDTTPKDSAKTDQPIPDLPDSAEACDSRAAAYEEMFANDDQAGLDSVPTDVDAGVAPSAARGEKSSLDGSSFASSGKKQNRIKVREKVREKVKVREAAKGSKPPTTQKRQQFDVASRSSYQTGTSRNTRFVDQVSELFTHSFSNMNAEKMWVLAFLTFIIGGVLCSASRGSILALIAATIITSAALAGRSGNRVFAAGLIALLLVGGGLMSWAGQSEFVQERFAQMFDPDMSEQGRVPNWQEALDTVPDNWSWGTGLGTYRYVYERFQHRFLSQTTHFHAENQFLQSLIEGGVIALLLLLAAIGLASWSVYKLFQFGGKLNHALAVAGTFALSSQFVGGMFDFGLYIPSNTILMSAICGIVIGRAALVSLIGNAEAFELAETADDGQHLIAGPTAEPQHDENASTDLAQLPSQCTLPANVTGRRVARSFSIQWRELAIRVRVPWLAMPTTIGILLLGCLFGSLEMHKAALVEQAIHASPLLIVREIEEPETVRSVIRPLASALNQRYDDAVGHQHMGELLQHLYRAETYQALLAAEPSLVMQVREDSPDTATDEEKLSPAEDPLNTSDRIVDLWVKSDMWHLHGTVRELQRVGDLAACDALLGRSPVEEFLKPAARHMTLARRFCPTIPHVHYALAELSVVPGSEPNEVLHLNRAKALSPGDATLLYWSGVLNMNSKRTEQAIADWNASLTLTSIYLNEIMEGSKGKLTLGTILNDVLPARSDLLLAVAQRKELSTPARKRAQRVFLRRAADSLPTTDLPPGQHAYTAGTIYRLLGRLDEAEQQFEIAIRHDPDHTGWLYQYTLTLFELGRLEEALEQANRLTEIQRHPAYQRLKTNIIQKQAENIEFNPTAMTSAPQHYLRP